jgi:hypothetical protein
MHRSLSLLLVLFAMPLVAARQPDFQGEWHFNAARGSNLGAMTALIETQTIEQTPQRLVIHDHATMMGQTVDRDVTLDLNGVGTPNDDAMGNHATTTSRWDGATLVTTWKTEGAVVGTTTERTEKRYLRRGAMVVESIRGTRPPMVFVYERR